MGKLRRGAGGEEEEAAGGEAGAAADGEAGAGAGADGEEEEAVGGEEAALQWVLESKLQKSVINFIHCHQRKLPAPREGRQHRRSQPQ